MFEVMKRRNNLCAAHKLVCSHTQIIESVMALGARMFHFRARVLTTLVRSSIFASEGSTINYLCSSTLQLWYLLALLHNEL